MKPEPTPEMLASMPPLYGQEFKEKKERRVGPSTVVPMGDKIVYLHIFGPDLFDWYLIEYDPEEQLFFGFCCLNDPQDAEWGYVDFEELRAIKVPLKMYIEGEVVIVGQVELECDRHWQPKKFQEIDKVRTFGWLKE